MEYKADIGVFGGSGFYSFLDDVQEVDVPTPFGNPSDKIALATVDGKKVAFLPRHGKNHQYPPHKIPYRANMHAMKQLGVKNIIAPTASGSLQIHIKPGDFVICDQFVDRTWGRNDTFFDGVDGITTDFIKGTEVNHTSPANTYCKNLRKLAIDAGNKLGITVHEKGTVVVIQGPRFSTIAESRWFAKMGWEVVNMTQYPEAYLAKEIGICYTNIALITDYDVGLEGNDEILPVSHKEVLKFFASNNERVKNMLFEIIKSIDINDKSCRCC